MSGSNFPVWRQVDAVPRQYPWLAEDTSCDVCVIGGGVTGAMCALRLAERGAAVILITAGELGSGDTANAMPCVQYDCGETMRTLCRRADKGMAAWVMSIAADAIDTLEAMSDGGMQFGFTRRDALLYADDPGHLELLSREFYERRKAGFDCRFISHAAARDVFAFDIAGAIMSQGLAAELDPYMLTHRCAESAEHGGARVFEHTKAERIDPCSSAGFVITTSTCRHITADKVVVAAGRAVSDIIDAVSAPRTEFIGATMPVTGIPEWPGRCVIRSFSSPEVTVSSSPDGRIFAGGMSTAVTDEQSRLGGIVRIPSINERRMEDLEADMRHLFPTLGELRLRYTCAVRRYRTADGLPIIGATSAQPGCIFAVAPGAGGVLMSVHAAETAADICAGIQPDEGEIFSPDRF